MTRPVRLVRGTWPSQKHEADLEAVQPPAGDAAMVSDYLACYTVSWWSVQGGEARISLPGKLSTDLVHRTPKLIVGQQTDQVDTSP